MESVQLFNFKLSENYLSQRKCLTLAVLIMFMILLSSCSSSISRDGPPRIYVDETRIPNAVPKAEPLAKFGNMPSYRVFGKRYYVMRTGKHYQETGIASWYGTKFHARRTSSGERYNLFAMTAAHKTLPLPTYVEVTNLANNRKIIVKVNDRGPFVSNRLIDLSYVGAKKLGMLGHGTAPVRVRAIDPHTYGRPMMLAKTVRPKNTGQFIPVVEMGAVRQKHLVYLQVGAFRNKANALKLKAQLSSLLSTPIKISYSTAKAKLYLVQVGPIKDLITVDKLTHRLKVLGIKSNKIYGA